MNGQPMAAPPAEKPKSKWSFLSKLFLGSKEKGPLKVEIDGKTYIEDENTAELVNIDNPYERVPMYVFGINRNNEKLKDVI